MVQIRISGLNRGAAKKNIMMNTVNIGRLRSILNRACHPGTPDKEALIAARKGYDLLDKAGLSMDDLSIEEASNEIIFELEEQLRNERPETARLIIEKEQAEAATRRAETEALRVKNENSRLKEDIQNLRAQRSARVSDNLHVAPGVEGLIVGLGK